MKTEGLSEREKREGERKFCSVRSGCSSGREHKLLGTLNNVGYLVI